MSDNNRKGYTTIKVGSQHIAVKQEGKAARIAAHKLKQMNRQRKLRIREYKAQLREAKKRIPLAQRSHIRIADL